LHGVRQQRQARRPGGQSEQRPEEHQRMVQHFGVQARDGHAGHRIAQRRARTGNAHDRSVAVQDVRAAALRRAGAARGRLQRVQLGAVQPAQRQPRRSELRQDHRDAAEQRAAGPARRAISFLIHCGVWRRPVAAALRSMRPQALLLSLLLLSSTAFAGWSSSGPIGGPVTSVVVAPSDSAVVWAASVAGVFRSTDGGTTWNDVSGAFADVRAMAVHPSDAKRAWAINVLGHVFRTDDGGATWSDTKTPILSPSALLVDPHDPDTLYAGGDCGPISLEGPAIYDGGGGVGIFKSTD